MRKFDACFPLLHHSLVHATGKALAGIALLASIVTGQLIPNADATDVYWVNEGGGDFGYYYNWAHWGVIFPPIEGWLSGWSPTATDTAIFDRVTSGRVQFFSDAQSSELIFGSNGTFQLNGNTYQTGKFSIGASSGAGEGSLTIELGTLISTDNSPTFEPGTRLGTASNLTSTLTINGPGSYWIEEKHFYIGAAGFGNNGTGILNVTNGGEATTNWNAYLGFDKGNTGRAIVEDTGSTWTQKSLLVGDAGEGTLTIRDGGSVHTTNNATIAVSDDIWKQYARGKVIVGGSGSAAEWTVDGNLTVGRTETHGIFTSTGQLEIQSGGQVTVANGSQLEIRELGTVVLNGGTLKVETLDNTRNVSWVSNNGFQFNGGRLEVTNYLGDLTNNFGTYAPGGSTAISTLAGDYTQGADGTLEIELAGIGAGDFDWLQVEDIARIDGTLEILLNDGFMPQNGDTFTFLTGRRVLGIFDTILLPGSFTGNWDITYGYDYISLTASTVPVPAAVWLFGSGIIGLIIVARRKA